jgi:hypothetical protein
MSKNLFDFLKEHNVEIQINTNCPKCDFDYLSLKTNEVHVCGENRVVNVIDPNKLETITSYKTGTYYTHLDGSPIKEPECIACTYSGRDEAMYCAYGCPACTCKE